MTPAEARKLILASVDLAKSQGWEIAGGIWAYTTGNGRKFCCPLSALVGPDSVACAKVPGGYALDTASKILDSTYQSMDRFILGFDGGTIQTISQPDPWVKLGAELRAELL